MERLGAKVPDRVLPPFEDCTTSARDQFFRQLEGQNLAEAWERFHELLRRCPHHRLTRWMQVHTFYNGLRDATRTVIEASTGDALMKKTTDQAYEILEDIVTNSNQWPRDRITSGKAVGGADNEVLNNLVNHVAQLTKQQDTVNVVQSSPWELCQNSVEDSTVVQNVIQDIKQ